MKAPDLWPHFAGLQAATAHFIKCSTKFVCITYFLLIIFDTIEGEQNILSQNIPPTFWQVDYFEVKSIKKIQQTQEKIFASPLTTN